MKKTRDGRSCRGKKAIVMLLSCAGIYCHLCACARAVRPSPNSHFLGGSARNLSWQEQSVNCFQSNSDALTDEIHTYHFLTIPHTQISHDAPRHPPPVRGSTPPDKSRRRSNLSFRPTAGRARRDGNVQVRMFVHRIDPWNVKILEFILGQSTIINMHRGDNAGGDMPSAVSCQEIAGCRWAQLTTSDSFGCIRQKALNVTGIQEAQANDVNPSCPRNTVARFTSLIGLDEEAVRVYVGVVV